MSLNAAGGISSINTQSTSDQGNTLKNIASAAGAIAPIAGLDQGEAAAGTIACNAGPVVVSVERYTPPAAKP